MKAKDDKYKPGAETITLDEYRALDAAGKITTKLHGVNRGRARYRQWEAHFATQGDARYGRHA